MYSLYLALKTVQWLCTVLLIELDVTSRKKIVKQKERRRGDLMFDIKFMFINLAVIANPSVLFNTFYVTSLLLVFFLFQHFISHYPPHAHSTKEHPWW